MNYDQLLESSVPDTFMVHVMRIENVNIFIVDLKKKDYHDKVLFSHLEI